LNIKNSTFCLQCVYEFPITLRINDLFREQYYRTTPPVRRNCLMYRVLEKRAFGWLEEYNPAGF